MNKYPLNCITCIKYSPILYIHIRTKNSTKVMDQIILSDKSLQVLNNDSPNPYTGEPKTAPKSYIYCILSGKC